MNDTYSDELVWDVPTNGSVSVRICNEAANSVAFRIFG